MASLESLKGEPPPPPKGETPALYVHIEAMRTITQPGVSLSRQSVFLMEALALSQWEFSNMAAEGKCH